MHILNKILGIVVLCFVFLLVSCEKDSRLFVVEKNEYYGYVNAEGDTVINCKYPLVFTDTISRIGFVANDEGNIECLDNKGNFLFYVYKYDNGPDYPREGCFRIVNKQGLIGFADTLGNIVISPKYKFAYPFSDGRAKVTDMGKAITVGDSLDNYEYWKSDKWYFIRHK